MADIRSLNAVRAHKQNDNSLMSPVECLEDAAQDIRSGKLRPTAALIITLNTKDGAYNTNFRASNLSASQQIALLEVHKAVLLRMMGYVPE